jgi:hypothetical protein
MTLDGSYNMVLLPPPRDNGNGGRQPARRRRNRRHLPPVAKEQHPGLSRHLPRRRRRRRGNHGQAGGGTSSAVERVDDAGAPAGDTSGVDLASETKTGVISLQHANPKRTDGASTLAKDLLGVSLVPEITVQSVPDATSSPSADQEVPSVFHPVPFRFSFDPPSDPASTDAFVKAYPNLPGHHMWSTRDRLTAVSTYGPLGSEEDDEPDYGWDFSGLDNPSAMWDFMTACDYCLSDCSDGSHSLDDEDCGPSRECFHIDLGGLDEGNHLGMPEDGDPPRPAPRVDILRELAVVPVPARVRTHSSSKSARCRPGSTRKHDNLCSSSRTSSRSGQTEHQPGKRVICPRTSSTASLTMPGQGCPGFQWGQPEPGCSSNTTPSDAGTIHHRGAAYPGRAQESPRGCRGPMGRKLCLPKAGIPPGASRRDFPIHARSLGPHWAHAGHSACGPGPPRQRAPSPRLSSPPRREGAPRLPP